VSKSGGETLTTYLGKVEKDGVWKADMKEKEDILQF
jgi:hypothetical protein